MDMRYRLGMTKQLRIEYEGAFYYVLSGGNERKEIFRGNGVTSVLTIKDGSASVTGKRITLPYPIRLTVGDFTIRKRLRVLSPLYCHQYWQLKNHLQKLFFLFHVS
ncbi:MAG: hypothetical protein HOI47_18750 [Candidatus Scalindua sp.]|nr:hypothetical protein [Candidatus Scalindua sp.]MBT6050660.1 hypothetical protein [Candidatus Scalindua sp.]MBT6228686.1 hypothetical protein [Candidatus Scalindua sp.]